MKQLVWMYTVLASLLVAMAIGISYSRYVNEVSVPCQLQDISVTVRCENEDGRLICQGSGTLISKEIDGCVRTFVLTAAHVVEPLRRVEIVRNSVGEKSNRVTFYDPLIVVQKRNEYGLIVERRLLPCKVVKYSNADTAMDIAILLVRQKNAFPLSVRAQFMPSGWVPKLGTELCHCGSLLGEIGANSYTTGVLSKVGRGQWDQIDVTTFPGSSGGGIYTRSDGKYAGMLVRGHRVQGFNLMVPIRDIHDWAASCGLSWLFDNSAAMPSIATIDKVHVEDDAEIVESLFTLGSVTMGLHAKPVVMHFYAPWC